VARPPWLVTYGPSHEPPAGGRPRPMRAAVPIEERVLVSAMTLWDASAIAGGFSSMVGER
jgi:hypothetical protein